MNPPASFGPVSAQYTPRPLQAARTILLLLLALGSTLVLLAVAAIQMYLGYTGYGPAAAYTWGLPWLFAGLLAGAAWAVYLMWRAASARRYLHVHRCGLVISGFWPFPKGWVSLLQPAILPWESLSGIATHTIRYGRPQKAGPPTPARYETRLFLKKGRPILLYGTHDGQLGLQNLPELNTRLKAAHYPRRLPEIRREYQGAQLVYFGHVAISKAGLFMRGQVWPWWSGPLPFSRVRSLSIQHGYLVVELERQGAGPGSGKSPQTYTKRLPVSQIANPELLLQIIQEG